LLEGSTPGPWTWDAGRGGRDTCEGGIRGPDGQWLLWLGDSEPYENSCGWYDCNADRPLLAAAPDLAHTVIALEGAHMEALTERAVFEARALAAEKERDAALARVARLEREIDIERGGESQLPPGWHRGEGRSWHGPSVTIRGTVIHGLRCRVRADHGIGWEWDHPAVPVDPTSRTPGYARGTARSALEAMEAADAAGEPR
jgi:hypothetical protein